MARTQGSWLSIWKNRGARCTDANPTRSSDAPLQRCDERTTTENTPISSTSGGAEIAASSEITAPWALYAIGFPGPRVRNASPAPSGRETSLRGPAQTRRGSFRGNVTEDSGHKPKIGHLQPECVVTFRRNDRPRSSGKRNICVPRSSTAVVSVSSVRPAPTQVVAVPAALDLVSPRRSRSTPAWPSGVACRVASSVARPAVVRGRFLPSLP